MEVPVSVAEVPVSHGLSRDTGREFRCAGTCDRYLQVLTSNIYAISILRSSSVSADQMTFERSVL